MKSYIRSKNLSKGYSQYTFIIQISIFLIAFPSNISSPVHPSSHQRKRPSFHISINSSVHTYTHSYTPIHLLTHPLIYSSTHSSTSFLIYPWNISIPSFVPPHPSSHSSILHIYPSIQPAKESIHSFINTHTHPLTHPSIHPTTQHPSIHTQTHPSSHSHFQPSMHPPIYVLFSYLFSDVSI
jgi:hypothetical protein